MQLHAINTRQSGPFKMQQKRQCKLQEIIGSLSKHHAYGNLNATKQEHDRLKEGKESCCTCSTHFSAFLCRTPKNNNVKSPNLRFRRQREHIAMNRSFSVLTLKPFVPIQLQDSSPVLYKVNGIVRLYCTR